MIFIPAILIAIAEAATIGLLTGAVICGMEDKRSLPSDAPKSERTAHKCAEQGAATGVVFGLVWPVIGLADDIAISSANSVDDLATALRRGMRLNGKGPTRYFLSPIKREANISRAQYYKSLRAPKIANPKEGFTYVAKVENVASKDLYKIGFSKNPAQRLKEIQVKLNRTVGGKVKFTCIIPTKNMVQLESAVHALFDAQRLRNFAAGTEFFNLNPAQLAAACSF